MYAISLCFCFLSYKKKDGKRWRAKSSCSGDKYRRNYAHTQKIWVGQTNKEGDKRHRRIAHTQKIWVGQTNKGGDKQRRRVAHTQKHVRRWANRNLLQHLEASELEQQLLGTRMLEVHRSLSVLTITLQSEYGANAKTLVLNGAPLLQARGIRIRGRGCRCPSTVGHGVSDSLKVSTCLLELALKGG